MGIICTNNINVGALNLRLRVLRSSLSYIPKLVGPSHGFIGVLGGRFEKYRVSLITWKVPLTTLRCLMRYPVM